MPTDEGYPELGGNKRLEIKMDPANRDIIDPRITPKSPQIDPRVDSERVKEARGKLFPSMMEPRDIPSIDPRVSPERADDIRKKFYPGL